jgi:hypothetical protein
MPPVEFETTISAGERPQNYALERAATGTGVRGSYIFQKYMVIIGLAKTGKINVELRCGLRFQCFVQVLV